MMIIITWFDLVIIAGMTFSHALSRKPKNYYCKINDKIAVNN